MTLLRVESITAGYGDTRILDSVDLTVNENETVAVIGPNGAGKSTLLKCVAGLVPVRSGKIFIDSIDCTAMRAEERPGLGITYVAQSSNVFPPLSVWENLEVVLPRFTPKNKSRDRISELISIFPELAGLLPKPAVFLSGGQRQIVAVCAALMRSPRLMLMDEPSAGLSPLLVERMLEHIARIRELGISVLLVEQNARQGLKISNRGYVLDSGCNVATGSGAELLNDSRTIELYVGRTQ